MTNFNTVFETPKKSLLSYLEQKVEQTDIIDHVSDDTYPFEYFMQISNRMKIHKFYEDIRVGDVVIGSVSRVMNTKLDICLLCTSGTLVRDIYHLKIPATCASLELPASTNCSTQTFQRGDLVKTIVININRNSNIEVSMNQHNVNNKLKLTDLGLCSHEHIPRYFQKLRDIKNPPGFFYDLFNTQLLSSSLEIKDKLKLFNLNTVNFSLLDSVNKIEIKPDETAKSLRNSLLMKESKKFVVKGVEYYKDSKYNEALQCYNHALSINESNVDALVARGALRATLKSYELSIADLEKAVKLEPSHKNAADYLSKTIIAYSKSLPKSEINKVEVLVKKHMLLENEIKEQTKNDISNPNNFIVISDDELTNCSKLEVVKSKERKKRKHKKHKKSHRKKSKSHQSLSSDTISIHSSRSTHSSDSSYSKQRKPRRSIANYKKAKRNSSLSSRSERTPSKPHSSKSKHKFSDVNKSIISSERKRKYSPSSSPSSRSSERSQSDMCYQYKFRRKHNMSMEYKQLYSEHRSRNHNNKDLRLSVSGNVHSNNRYSDYKYHGREIKASRDNSSENSFKKIDYYSNSDIINRKSWGVYGRHRNVFTDHLKFSDNHNEEHGKNIRNSITESSVNQPNERSNFSSEQSSEKNAKLKAADEEIRKIEEFICQLKNNVKP